MKDSELITEILRNCKGEFRSLGEWQKCDLLPKQHTGHYTPDEMQVIKNSSRLAKKKITIEPFKCLTQFIKQTEFKITVNN